MNQLNYFGAEEQAAQEKFQQQRDRCFAPIVRGLARLGVTPNAVSLLGILMLAPFAYLVLAYPEPRVAALASGFILLHVVLDGLDGPLARHYGKTGKAGALVDICCDQGGMVIVAWVLSAAGMIDGTIGSMYVLLYTTVVVFVIWLNSLGRQMRLVFRSKYLFYALIVLYGVTGWNWILTPALAAFSVVHLLQGGYGLFRLLRVLDSERDADSEAEPDSAADDAGSEQLVTAENEYRVESPQTSREPTPS